MSALLSRKLLLGIGNFTMGDDSIGIRVIEAIATRKLDQAKDGSSLFESIEMGDGGLNLLSYFEPEVEKMVWVDCVRAGLRPGEIVIFSPEEAESRKLLSTMTTHEGDMLQVLDLARANGYPIPKIRILGIEPDPTHLGFSLELSASLSRNFETYLELALQEVK